MKASSPSIVIITLTKETFMSDRAEKVPDPATTYERAKPAKESVSGKLDAPKTRDAENQDELQKQNKSPDGHPPRKARK